MRNKIDFMGHSQGFDLKKELTDAKEN